MGDNGATPYSIVFKNTDTGQTLTVGVSMPFVEKTPSGGHRWRCDYFIQSDKTVGVNDHVYGGWWLSAMLLAYEVATLEIAKDEAKWETSDGLPLWRVRPEVVQIGWGYECFDRCRQLIRAEVRSAQDAIAQCRRAAEHSDAARTTAETRLALLTRLGEHVNDMTALIGEFPDAEEQKQLRRPLGDLLLELVDRMQPIYRAYPDLDPDRPDDQTN